MKPPMCKLCGERHWTYEPHEMKGAEIRPSKPWPANPPPPTVTANVIDKHCSTCSCNAKRNGRSDKKHQTNAERQRAYRGRK